MMISINLRPGQKRKPSGAGKQITAKLKEFAARVKDPLLAGVVAAWIVVAGWLAYTWGSTGRQMSRAGEQLEQTATEAKRFETLMQQKHKAERIRDSLQTQIGVIRGVDRGRYVWPHVLDEVAKTLPAYTWLTDVVVLGTAPAAPGAVDSTSPRLKFQINGRTVDYQAFTQFLRQLEASPWVEDVQTLKSETVVENQRPVTSFQITAVFAEADSAYIRTVPLAQSVR
ncbi:MAG: PilN domain-containing protein [Gemmatimonadetes bacterium]|nr:PilN domain-containing protein [Gemmatimonadota bacterium]